jgi:hypothetical protein
VESRREGGERRARSVGQAAPLASQKASSVEAGDSLYRWQYDERDVQFGRVAEAHFPDGPERCEACQGIPS